jgi:hypothetical protein
MSILKYLRPSPFVPLPSSRTCSLLQNEANIIVVTYGQILNDASLTIGGRRLFIVKEIGHQVDRGLRVCPRYRSFQRKRSRRVEIGLRPALSGLGGRNRAKPISG